MLKHFHLHTCHTHQLMISQLLFLLLLLLISSLTQYCMFLLFWLKEEVELCGSSTFERWRGSCWCLGVLGSHYLWKGWMWHVMEWVPVRGGREREKRNMEEGIISESAFCWGTLLKSKHAIQNMRAVKKCTFWHITALSRISQVNEIQKKNG